MTPYRTDSIIIADLSTISSILLPLIDHAYHGFQPGMQITPEQLEYAFDWIITQALLDALLVRDQIVEVTHHYTHDLYKCLYRTPEIYETANKHLAWWLDNQRLSFTSHTRIKLLVTYQQLILVRKL